MWWRGAQGADEGLLGDAIEFDRDVFPYRGLRPLVSVPARVTLGVP